MGPVDGAHGSSAGLAAVVGEGSPLRPYYAGKDPEYDWYRDADSDGIVRE